MTGKFFLSPYDFGYGKHAPSNGDINEYLGRKVICYNKTGVVVRVKESSHKTYHMNGSVIPSAAILVVYENGDEHGPIGDWTDACNVAEPGKTIIHWHYDLDARVEAPERDRLYVLWKEADIKRGQARQDAETRRLRTISECDAIWKRITPEWAKAYVVAELMEDDSDIQSDYFGSHTTKTVVLAFSKTTRNNFSEFRKAAALYEETASLGTEGEEHREDYSGGSGLYLGTKRGKYSGWIIRKRRFGNGVPQGGNHLVEFLPSLTKE